MAFGRKYVLRQDLGKSFLEMGIWEARCCCFTVLYGRGICGRDVGRGAIRQPRQKPSKSRVNSAIERE